MECSRPRGRQQRPARNAGEDNKEVHPVFFLFVKEKLPLIYPIICIIAKALAESASAVKELDYVVKFFNTKLGLPAVQIYWKREF